MSSNVNKVRVIALYIQHRDGVPDEDRRRLYQHARLSMAEQDAVNALVHMGIRISRVSHLTFQPFRYSMLLRRVLPTKIQKRS